MTFESLSVRPIQAAEQGEIPGLVEAVAPALRLRDLPATIAAWTNRASGEEEHILGLWRGGALLGAARMIPGKRLRCRHEGYLRLFVRPGVDPTPLVQAMVDLVDDWSDLVRLETDLPADHEALPALRAAGFQDEVRRMGRMMGGVDNLLLARLRPGFVPRPSGPTPPWPPRRADPDAAVTMRALTEADSAGVAALSTAPTTVWGTLQCSSSNDLFYARRFQNTPPGNHILIVEVGGVIAGHGGLHPTSEPDVLALGMGFHPDFQGRGLGKRLMAEQLRLAAERGARRVELGVWEDNTRAIALYEASGFVYEGTRRYNGIRTGGHCSTLDMALTLIVGSDLPRPSDPRDLTP